MLSEHEDIPQKHLETIGSITNQLQRLTRLNKALLLLTKIENRQFAMQEKVQINPLIRQLVEQFEDLATSKNIQIQLVEVGELVLTAHPDLISILISNLIKNGLVHNISGGQVKVLITEDSISVSNSAQGAALDPKLIFRRFQKFTSDSQRVGLGLAIVKAICDACNLQMDYSWSNGFHQFSCGLRK